VNYGKKAHFLNKVCVGKMCDEMLKVLGMKSDNIGIENGCTIQLQPCLIHITY